MDIPDLLGNKTARIQCYERRVLREIHFPAVNPFCPDFSCTALVGTNILFALDVPQIQHTALILMSAWG